MAIFQYFINFIGAFILGYGQWLQHIPKHIDYTLCKYNISCNIYLSNTNILKDADRIFLLPLKTYEKLYEPKHSLQLF